MFEKSVFFCKNTAECQHIFPPFIILTFNSWIEKRRPMVDQVPRSHSSYGNIRTLFNKTNALPE